MQWMNPICNRTQVKGATVCRNTVAEYEKLDTAWMIYTILQLARAVSVLTDLITEDVATIIGILKGVETRHI
jgi:hypothetical protein